MASVDWGPWGDESKGIRWSWGDPMTCITDYYAKPATTTIVIGRLLSILLKTIQPGIVGSLKSFCIGHSLGGHTCGFAGRDYRFEAKSH